MYPIKMLYTPYTTLLTSAAIHTLYMLCCLSLFASSPVVRGFAFIAFIILLLLIRQCFCFGLLLVFWSPRELPSPGPSPQTPLHLVTLPPLKTQAPWELPPPNPRLSFLSAPPALYLSPLSPFPPSFLTSPPPRSPAPSSTEPSRLCPPLLWGRTREESRSESDQPTNAVRPLFQVDRPLKVDRPYK